MDSCWRYYFIILLFLCSKSAYTQQHGIIASSIQTGGGSYTGILDDIPSAGLAYGVRKLRAAYSGSCIRIIRGSDSAEQDIGFDGSGNLDVASIASFCTGTTGYVLKWYDQSGNAIDADAYNVSPPDQYPIIYESGAVVTLNSLPAIRFTHPRAFYFTTSSSLSSLVIGGTTKSTTGHFVGQQGSTATQPWKVVIEDGDDGSEILQFYDDGSSERIEFITTASGFATQFTYDAQKAWCWRVNDDTWNIYENGSSLASASNAASPTLANSGMFIRIGGGSFASRNLEGYAQEIIIWPTVEDPSAIFTNVDAYFSIP